MRTLTRLPCAISWFPPRARPGALALEYFRPGARTSARVEMKAGGSPVSEADLEANLLLKRRLREALPQAGWLSEETVDDFERLTRRSLIVVDPIDGTRAFVTGDPRWAVSAALVVEGRPIAGAVYAPALGRNLRRRARRGRDLQRRDAWPRLGLAAARRGGPQAHHRGDGRPAWRRGRDCAAHSLARLSPVHGGAGRGRFRRRGREFA